MKEIKKERFQQRRKAHKRSRTMGILMLAFLALAMTACGGKEKKDNKKTAEEDHYVYQASFQKFDSDVDQISGACIRDGRVYMLGMKYEGSEDNNYRQNIYLLNCGPDGSDIRQSKLSLKETIYPDCFGINGTEGFYLLATNYEYNEKTNESKQSYLLYMLDTDGKITGENKIEVKEFQGDHAYFFTENVAMTPQGLCISLDSKIYVLDKTGKLNASYDFGGYIQGMLPAEDGKLYVLGRTQGTDGCILKEMDVKTGALTTITELNEKQIYNASMRMDGNGNIYINDQSNLYLYDIASKKTTTLLSWINCDVNGDNITNYFPMDGGTVLAINSTYENEKTEIEFVSLKKVKASDVAEKKVFTLACMYADYFVKNKILDFNRTNGNYRIEVKDYSEYEDPEARFNLDITSGDIPDILEIGSLPVSECIKKGMVADLYPLMEKDGEISKEDFLESIIDAVEQDGKLYYMGSSFGVQFLIGNKKQMGDIQGWTFDDMKKLYDHMPKGGVFMKDATKQWFLQSIMTGQMDQYINWEKKEVYFNSEDFVKMLEFSKNFPDEQDNKNDDMGSSMYITDDMDENADEISYTGGKDSMPMLVKKGKLMLNELYMTEFENIEEYSKLYKTCGGLTVLSYPSADGNTKLPMLPAGTWMAIMEDCDDKEGAWEFIKEFLSYDYQKEYIGMPTRKDAFEKKLEYAMATKAYTDEDGTKVTPLNYTYGYEDYTIKIGPLTKEEASEIRSIAERIGSFNNYDSREDAVYNIVSEEAEGFFSGDKTAKETAEIIQSRVKIYVSENS